MSERSCLAVILAAGEGTRMKSALSKVLAPGWRLADGGACGAGGERGPVLDAVALVVGRDADKVEAGGPAICQNSFSAFADRAAWNGPCGAGCA